MSEPPTTAEASGAVEAAGHWRRRLFSTPPGRPRFRRATDALLLVAALLALAGLILAYPPSRFQRSFAVFLDGFPGWLDPLWGITYDALALWAAVLGLAALVSRRPAVWLQAVASLVVAFAVTVVSGRIALGRWPDLDGLLRLQVDDSSFAVLRVAASAAVILAIAPHVVRPLQSFGRWVLVLGLVGALLVEDAPPSASVTAWVVALVAATIVRLAFGTSAGHPESSEVALALAELGVPVRRLEPADRQRAGVFVARGEDAEGRSLLVKVYGRDAYDTQLLEKAWRTLLYQGESPRVRLSRLEAVESEALLTLLARGAGLATREVVIAATASSGDVLLVFRDETRPLADLPAAQLDDALLARAWEALAPLAAARIAHQRIDPETLVLVGEAVGLVDLDRARAAPRPERFVVDRAQLLAATASLVGVERAVDACVVALGADGVAELLPYLQPAALGPSLRKALRAGEVDVDELRTRAAEAVGAEAPELIKLRRLTWWSAVQVALLALAISTVVGALAGLDYEELGAYLEDASWGWVAVGAVVAQLPRLTQAISTLGSVPAQLPFVPVYLMQLATGYMNLALPSNFARMAINIRFFQRQGVPPTTAVTAGAIDSFVSTVVQAVLLGLLVLFSVSSLELDLDTPSGPSTRSLVIVVVLAVAALTAVWLVRKVRNAILERVRTWWPDVRRTIEALRAGRKLALLLGGSLATELLFATALGVFANAFGHDIALVDLLLINISVSLLASFVPVPGGIGVAEFGLTVGLTAAGMPEEAALATALLYRAATFYAPPVWGFFAMRWLQRNALL